MSSGAAARLEIVERAGHDPYSEQAAEVMTAIRDFTATDTADLI